MSTSDSKVVCPFCERTVKVNFAKCLREGWPLCCGSTMELKTTQANIDDAVGEACGGLADVKRLTGQQEA